MSSTAFANFSGPVAAGSYFTVATLVAKFTLADSTPGCLPRRFSIRFAHEAQVIPSMGRSARSMAVLAVWSVGAAAPPC